MMTAGEQLRQRNQEISQILARARQEQERSVTECAGVLGTSRRRYRAIEAGAVAVTAAELEVLMRYLHVPAQAVWRDLSASVPARHVVVQAQPGETVQLVVEVQG
jgi:predicted transcriptional regulator